MSTNVINADASCLGIESSSSSIGWGIFFLSLPHAQGGTWQRRVKGSHGILTALLFS
jgi:hypothetical protein